MSDFTRCFLLRAFPLIHQIEISSRCSQEVAAPQQMQVPSSPPSFIFVSLLGLCTVPEPPPLCHTPATALSSPEEAAEVRGHRGSKADIQPMTAINTILTALEESAEGVTWEAP